MKNRGKTITFVCTGNVCRSPMAEYLFRAFLGPQSDWTVRSAGVAAYRGMPASEEAVTALREVDIDLTPHAAQPLNRELVDGSDVLVVMTSAHREQVLRAFPGTEQKVFLLKSFGKGRGKGEDIYDPIGLSLDVYRGVKREITAVLPDLADFLKGLAVNRPAGQ